MIGSGAREHALCVALSSDPAVTALACAPGNAGTRAFAEARYFGWKQLDSTKKLPVKDHSLAPAALLGSEERARPFRGGPVLLARLSPMDSAVEPFKGFVGPRYKVETGLEPFFYVCRASDGARRVS